jgi:hypothetical protein
MMDHPGLDILNRYADGDLSPTERSAIDAHAAACGDCRSTLDGLARLAAAARAARADVEPARDLWPDIRSRLSPRGRRSAWWFAGANRPALAAAALLLVVGSSLVTALLVRRPPPGRPTPASPAGVAFAAADARYVSAAAELSAALETQRPTLSPATVAVVERNLAIVDSAIAEARTALLADPNNRALVEMLAASHRQKIDLLQRTIHLLPRT